LSGINGNTYASAWHFRSQINRNVVVDVEVGAAIGARSTATIATGHAAQAAHDDAGSSEHAHTDSNEQ